MSGLPRLQARRNGCRQPQNTIVNNVVLAVFNMLAIPRWTADGSRRIAPGCWLPLSRLEPYGMLILIGTLIIFR